MRTTSQTLHPVRGQVEVTVSPAHPSSAGKSQRGCRASNYTRMLALQEQMLRYSVLAGGRGAMGRGHGGQGGRGPPGEAWPVWCQRPSTAMERPQQYARGCALHKIRTFDEGH